MNAEGLTVVKRPFCHEMFLLGITSVFYAPHKMFMYVPNTYFMEAEN